MGPRSNQGVLYLVSVWHMRCVWLSVSELQCLTCRYPVSQRAAKILIKAKEAF